MLERSKPENRHAFKALLIVAETNDHHALELVRAIKTVAKEADPEKKSALGALLHVLSKQQPFMPHIKCPKEKPREEKRKDQPPPDDGEAHAKRKRKTEDQTAGNKKAEKKGGSNDPFPYPLEYYLFKLVSTEEYAESARYYMDISTNLKSAREEEQKEKPELTRAYLTAPRLSQAQKVLYGSPFQCKVCALRLNSPEQNRAHNEAHTKKSAFQNLSGQMWRPWLLDLSQWTSGAQQHVMTIRDTIEEVQENVPVQGERDKTCAVCHEPFEIAWDDREECWIFLDAILVKKDPARQICHRRCVR